MINYDKQRSDIFIPRQTRSAFSRQGVSAQASTLKGLWMSLCVWPPGRKSGSQPQFDMADGLLTVGLWARGLAQTGLRFWSKVQSWQWDQVSCGFSESPGMGNTSLNMSGRATGKKKKYSQLCLTLSCFISLNKCTPGLNLEWCLNCAAISDNTDCSISIRL